MAPTADRPKWNSSFKCAAAVSSLSQSARSNLSGSYHSYIPPSKKKLINEIQALLHKKNDAEELTRQRKDEYWRRKCELNVILKQWQTKIDNEARSLENLQNEIQSKIIQIGEIEAEERLVFDQIVDLKGKIRVGLRLRRALPGETIADKIRYCRLENDGISVGDKRFPGHFAHLWLPEKTQDDIFTDVQDFIRSALNGHNVAVIFYGESGSGKTYTMLGGPGDSRGLLTRSVGVLFDTEKSLLANGWQFSFTVTSYEIYNEQFADLLDKKSFRMPRFINGVLDCSNFRTIPIYTCEDATEIVQSIMKIRSAARTELNWSSSRSHCIFSININAVNVIQERTLSSVLTFVDLAGSERLDKSLSEGMRLIEATFINRSLLSLRNVIRTQFKEEGVVRYRDSKLTMALSSCLGADASKTFLIVTLSPNIDSFTETLRSLSFASEASATSIGPVKPKCL